MPRLSRREKRIRDLEGPSPVAEKKKIVPPTTYWRKRGYMLYAYLAIYPDETSDPKHYIEQYRSVVRLRPDHMVFDRPYHDHMPSPLKRSGFKRFVGGLLPGDVVAVSDLSRLGVTPKQTAEALSVLRYNEVRVYDIDPDGLHYWRPAVENYVKQVAEKEIAIAEFRRSVSESMSTGTRYVGVGWATRNSRFLPLENMRDVCRSIVTKHDAGQSFAQIAENLSKQGVFYVGCMHRAVFKFDGQLAAECYRAAKEGFPYPVDTAIGTPE